MLLFGKQGALLTEVELTDVVDEIRVRIEEAATC
jgi:hypothetical protein